jgi:hypothetical protein
MTAKLHKLGYELLPHLPYSPILQIWPPLTFFLFADLKKMLDGKKFSTNEEVFFLKEGRRIFGKVMGIFLKIFGPLAKAI